MGTVWRAEQLSTHREVAIKILGTALCWSDRARARFEREVELAARLEHANIARVYDSGLYHGIYYYAMGLVEGVPLDQHVAARGLRQREVLELMRTIAQAVQYAHQRGIIHRDLKPSNILVTHDGRPCIVDFGLAKAFLESESDLSVSADGEVQGTPAYMAPEQAAGQHSHTDTRTDVYTLGVILFGLLTGHTPHDLTGKRYEILRRIAEEGVRRPRAVSKAIDKDLEAILLKALAHDPENRYPTAGSLANDIDSYLRGEVISARPYTAFNALHHMIRRYPVAIGIALMLLAVLVDMAVVAYVRIDEERQRAEAVAAEKDLEIRTLQAEAAFRSESQRRVDEAAPNPPARSQTNP